MTIASPSIAIGLIIVLGVGAQWLAWRLRLPSILLMLTAGLCIGPIWTMVAPGGKAEPLLDPNAIFGDLLFPLVSISVGLILYEGGLTLRFKEVRGVGVVVWRLVTVGAAVTWVLASIAAVALLGLSWQVSLLLGAILTVTGPTVIGPLLRQVRPRGEGGAILRWEGIVVDPIGALLAVLVFEVVAAGHGTESAAHAIGQAVLLTILVGGGLGAAAAIVLTEVLHRYWAPEYLQNPLSLLLAVAVFVAANAIQHESGLLATTVMGMVLANQRRADIHHIVEFKENLRVLLLAGLFVTLGARVSVEDVQAVGWSSVAFAAVLIAVIRPLNVLASTVGTRLGWSQRALIACIAPRGIVAAAIASVFAIRLEAAGRADATALAANMFAVILITVAWYGLTAGRVARLLGLADNDPQGVLFIGASRWVRAVAGALNELGIRVRVADANFPNVSAARQEGLAAWYGNVLTDHAAEEIDLTGIGSIIAATPNDEVNTLASQRFARAIGRQHVFQLAPAGTERRRVARDLQGRRWISDEATYAAIDNALARGGIIKSTMLTPEFTFQDFRTLYSGALVLFVVSGKGRVTISTGARGAPPEPGQTVVAIVNPDELLLPIAEEAGGDAPPEPTP